VKATLEKQLTDFQYDLHPIIAEAHAKLGKPVDLPLGDAHGCASLKVLGIEAGPTVLADGIEKDLAIVIAPSVLIPCPDIPGTPLPPLANVATIQPGPFTVNIPVAAKYDELAKAMTLAFTDGKLFFTKEYPQLYLEKPEIYAAKDQLVLKLHMAGVASKLGLDLGMEGDIFFSGHPTVEDNELRIPDLEPTIETSNFFLKLKASLDTGSIRDQARAALRLDIAARLKSVREKLSTDLSVQKDNGCFHPDVQKIEVNGVHVHADYLRVNVAITATAALYMPCPAQYKK
jgi:hypothetical protein